MVVESAGAHALPATWASSRAVRDRYLPIRIGPGDSAIAIASRASPGAPYPDRFATVLGELGARGDRVLISAPRTRRSITRSVAARPLSRSTPALHASALGPGWRADRRAEEVGRAPADGGPARTGRAHAPLSGRSSR